MKKKQCRGRLVKGFVVLTAMILVSLLCACTEKETPEDKALQEAENWVKTNYEQIYEVRNLQSTLLGTEDTEKEMRYRILVQGETKYKYQSLEEIPFVKGMLDESRAQELTSEQQSAIDAYLEEVEDGANIGNYDEFAIEMIVSADKEMRFYDSKNLKDWNYMSSFGEGYGVQPCQFECPDMVELPIDGDINRKKWALIVNVNPGCYFGGSATQYFTGNFDGTKFICDNQPNVTKWLDWGKDHYATVCFSNTSDRTVAIPWMSNWQYCNIVPTKQFRSANALPRELGLYTQDGELYLSAAPVAETKTLRKENKEIPSFTVSNDYHIDSLLTDNNGAYELALEITTGKAEIMGFSLFNDKGEKVDIYFNLPEKRLVMDRTKSGIVDFGKNSVPHEIEAHDRRKTTSINYIDDFALATWAPIKKENKYALDIFIDKCSVEIFLNGGKIAMTNLVFPSEPYNRMCFYSKGGTFNVDSFNAYRLGL